MSGWKNKNGFTIVELLIVVVVIAILATITIVAYNTIQDRAKSSSVMADLNQASKSLEHSKTINTLYPSTVPNSNTTNSLTYNVSSSGTSYCLEASTGNAVYSVVNSSSTIQQIPCAQNGLLGWWNLNDSANDTLGNGNNGTVVDAVPTTGANGRANGAYTFTANSTTRINLPRPKDYTNLNSTGFSISAWMKTSSGQGQQAVFSTAGSINGVRFGHSNGRPYYLIGNTSYRENLLTSSVLLNDNQWHNLVTVFENKVNGFVVTSFIDGQQVATEATTVNSVGIGNTALIGAMAGAQSSAFSGSIDDVRIYGRALAANEALSIFTLGAQ